MILKPQVQSPFQSNLKLKAEFLPFTVLTVTHHQVETVIEELSKVMEQAPNYFNNAPIIIDVSAIAPLLSSFSIETLHQWLKSNHLVPIGIRGLSTEEERIQAKQLGLAILQKKKPTQMNDFTIIESKIVTHPVRAGTQVYAKKGDLIILSSINAGGECLADGNIHVYGTLRGRALAGANGNQAARIFCQSLDAELIAIAGHYEVKENIKVPKDHKGMIQIYLKDEQLHIDPI